MLAHTHTTREGTHTAQRSNTHTTSARGLESPPCTSYTYSTPSSEPLLSLSNFSKVGAGMSLACSALRLSSWLLLQVRVRDLRRAEPWLPAILRHHLGPPRRKKKPTATAVPLSAPATSLSRSPAETEHHALCPPSRASSPAARAAPFAPSGLTFPMPRVRVGARGRRRRGDEGAAQGRLLAVLRAARRVLVAPALLAARPVPAAVSACPCPALPAAWRAVRACGQGGGPARTLAARARALPSGEHLRGPLFSSCEL